MILWLVLTAVLVWTLVYRYRRRRLYELASRIPGLKEELPVIGLAHSVAGNNEDIMKTLQRISCEAMSEDKDGLIRAWLNNLLYFVMVHPADTEMVLKTCLEKDDLHKYIRKVIGYGGIFAPVSIWRRRRKILVPAFSPKIVENFVTVFAKQSEKLVKHLGNGPNTSFNTWPYLNKYSLDSVCESAMGINLNAQDDPDCAFLKAINKVLSLISERIFKIWLQPDWLYRLFPQYPEHERCIKIMHDFTDNVITDKRKQLKYDQETKTKIDTNLGLSSYKNKTFLDYLIQFSGGEKGYTDLELREEILTLAIASTDTSSVVMGFTLMLLYKYPEVQEKVYQELHKVFGDSERPLQKEDLPHLKYLERVIKESMRLFQPVPFIIRKVEKELVLPSGRILPAGSGVVVSLYGMHRNPKYWGPTAEHFDPDRFLPERFTALQASSFFPFSTGPRACLGYQYAYMSMKTALSTILRRYKVLGERESGPIPHIRVRLDIMMKSEEGYHITLQRRIQRQSA
uniref:Cytochrome P450 4v2 n=1 Tax=Carposina sasakii TaxID=252295 RepID=A0A411AG06_CARSA|nr:cytochrome P450 4v2 [Carposina sasakii]